GNLEIFISTKSRSCVMLTKFCPILLGMVVLGCSSTPSAPPPVECTPLPAAPMEILEIPEDPMEMLDRLIKVESRKLSSYQPDHMVIMLSYAGGSNDTRLFWGSAGNTHF